MNSYFPTKDTLFTLEPTPARHHCVLTKYGVIDVMRDDKTEEDIPDTLVYLKYLASRLCLVVFRKLGVYSAVDIIEEVRGRVDLAVRILELTILPFPFRP